MPLHPHKNLRPNNRPRHTRRCRRSPSDCSSTRKSSRRNENNHDDKSNIKDVENSRSGGDDGGVMDDVLAQLRRQRERSREACNPSSTPAVTPTASGSASGAVYSSVQPEQGNHASLTLLSSREADSGKNTKCIVNKAKEKKKCVQKRKEVERKNLSKKRNDRKNNTRSAAVSAAATSIEGYIYDPMKKRYFPASTFDKPNGNTDICIQRLQQSTANARKQEMISGIEGNSGGCEHGKSNFDFWVQRDVSDRDISRLLFRGTLFYQYISEPTNESDKLSSPSTTPTKRGKRKKNDIKSERDFDKLSEHQCGFFAMDQSISCNNHFSRKGHIPCSERTAALLFSSLRYCTNLHRRERIISVLGPMRIAHGSRIIHTATASAEIPAVINSFDAAVPIASPGDESVNKKNANKQRSSAIAQHSAKQSQHDKDDVPKKMWYSMLYPIIPFRRVEEVIINQHHPIPQVNAPSDCLCKSYLQPTAPTFDVLPVFSSSDNYLPQVVTIANNALYYRPSLEVPPDGRDAFLLGGCSISDVDAVNNFPKPVELLRSSMSDVYQGVRFAPFSTQDNVVVGSVSYNYIGEVASFSLQSTDNTRIDKKMLNDCVNDFCFSPGSTLDDPGIMAFAYGGESFGTLLYDISSETNGGAYNLRTEPLCVQFAKGRGNQQIYYGHRDGAVSMLDTRARKFHVLDLNSNDSFGSATALQTLYDENLLIAKGSFGSCRVYDLRFVKRDADTRQSYGCALFNMSIPHSGHKTKSVRCVGLATDINESIVASPFIDTKNGVELAIWCIKTGRLIRTLDVSKRKTALHSYSKLEDDGQSAAFCELSSVLTRGFDFIHEENSNVPRVRNLAGTHGAWFKTGSETNGSPFEIGGIHHVITG